ncbi:hypothetical protein FPV67DRAFT_1731334 [Lyophyllum atratum]|nr:hypothetical protein FPV67DRAFT_1731334 [Lyophyllum atratum]
MSTEAQTPGRRRTPRSDAQKMKDILNVMREADWSISKFLHHLFRLENRDEQHQQMVVGMINGTSKPRFGEILQLIYENAKRVDYRKGDKTATKIVIQKKFAPDLWPEVLHHAEPAMNVWAVRLVADLVRNEGKVMVKPDTGLHLRASAKPEMERTRNIQDKLASWEAVDGFSMEKMQGIAEENAPTLWHIVSSYVNPTYGDRGQVLAVREIRRPQNLVTTSAVMSLTFGRSERASLYALCRGIWYFSTKAHRSIFRVESRLAQCVAYSSVYPALKAMSEQQLKDLKAALLPGSGRHILTVGDNVQTFVKPRDHRIGRESKMIKGYAGTAVEMEDYEEGAFDLDELVRRQSLQQRRDLSAEGIMEDIDWTHQENVAAGDFTDTLLGFVPVLSVYKKDMEEWVTAMLTKRQIPQTRKSTITPLATNNADEMHVQGLKQGLLDFFSVQMGIDKETLQNRCFIKSGDGKTFDQLHKLKKYLAAEEGDFESFRWLVPLLELWHAKWTDLSRVARTHWGKDSPDDPSTLSFAARLAQCPTPSDLRKVDFYDGQHIVNLTLDAHLLNIWEGHFQTDNLVDHFANLKDRDQLPSFEALIDAARMLVKRHATTDAFRRAHKPEADHPDTVPLGSPWTRPSAQTETETVDVEMVSGEDETDHLSDMSAPEPESFSDADITLANSILFIRNAIWWREMCRAVARGDTGRIWEILKIWIFTFAGSGNPYYSQYLLELYCNFKWEFPPKLTDAILMNWVINLHGKPGMFIEMDLMQEHFNFWLEDMAQHKGKEFDEPFYRQVISMNVHHFLRLKDEMEAAVFLKARSKDHGARHLNNELKAIMKAFRAAEVDRRRPSRDEGFHGVDDLGVGLETLKKDKIENFIKRTTVFTDILGLRVDSTSGMEDDVMEDEVEADDERPDERHGPPPRVFVAGNELIIEERESV